MVTMQSRDLKVSQRIALSLVRDYHSFLAKSLPDLALLAKENPINLPRGGKNVRKVARVFQS